MNQPDASKILGLLQAFILLATVAGVFMSIGSARHLLEQNKSSVDELRSITMDLVKSQVLSASNDQQHARMLADLSDRIDRLEQRP